MRFADRPLVVAAGVAAVGAGLMMLVPANWSVTVGLGTESLGSGRPFDVTVTIDTERGLIESNSPLLGSYWGRVDGLAFQVAGGTGRGVVSIDAVGPEGEVLIADVVGPGQPISYPPDPMAPEWLLVEATPGEVLLPEPGGRVVFEIRVTNPAANPGPVEVVRFGPVPEGNRAMADSGRPDSCALVQLPVTLNRRGSIACTMALELTGRAGSVEWVGVMAESADPDSGTWSTEVRVGFGPPGTPMPAEPGPVAGDPGDTGPAPVRTGIITSRPGKYQLRMASEGSEGFNVWVTAQRPVRTWVWQESGPGLAVGLAFLAAAVAAATAALLRSGGARRIAGGILLGAGCSVAIGLLATRDLATGYLSAVNHDWYWKAWSHLVWIPALVTVAMGSRNLFARRVSRATLGIGVVAAVPAALLVAATALTSASWGEGGFIGGSYSGYSGDYMFMGLHVVALCVSTLLVAVAFAFLARDTRPRPDGAPASQEVPLEG